jgi:hypothetical protein
MERKDDRTIEQRRTHRWAVVARDKFMSGWGGAKGGASRCAVPATWAVDGSIDDVERWVRSRSEMIHVNVVDLATYRPPAGTAHFHIYVVTDSHPAAPQWRRRTAREEAAL